MKKEALGITLVILLLTTCSVSAISLRDNGFNYYVFGNDASITPILWFNQNGNDTALYVDSYGLTVYNSTQNNTWFRINGNVSGSGGTSDHGLLTGLGDDDHTQYILHTELNSETELETQIADVTNFWNNNDFADGSINWNNVFTLCYTTLDIDSLTSGEVDQLENIGVHSISSGEWGYVADMNQNVGDNDNVEFDHIEIADNIGASTLELNPTTNQNGELIFRQLGDKYWRYYLNQGGLGFMLEYYDGSVTYAGLESKLTAGFPSAIFWGFGGAVANYGITQGTTPSNNDKGYANQWIDASDPLIKKFIDLPIGKLFRLYDLINIQAYNVYNHYWDNDSNLILLDLDDKLDIGINAEELKEQLINEFGNKVINSLVYERDMDNETLMGINYRAVELALIEALRLKIDDMEAFLEHELGYVPFEWGV